LGDPLLRCVDLHKSFGPAGRRVDVLRGLRLSVDRGEMLAILGESGAGKSTLLHLIGAIDRPDAGAILVRGRNIAAAGAAERAAYRNSDLGFVFQFHHLLPEFSAVENAMMPLLIRGEDRRRARGRAVNLLEELGLGGGLDRRPTELSGGEQQRVAIARALAGGPSLLLADEPTGNLDERNAAAVFDMLLDLHRRRGMTTVLVTHSARLASCCNRVAVMEGGSLTIPEGGR
jgi:lipoprotein-releasing system ATP-binding protein